MTYRTRLSTAVTATIVCLVAISASAATLTFDELPFQPVNGLSFKGVTFGFEVGGAASADASYNSGGPGSTTYISDPSLEGDARGLLELVFGEPIATLSFGLALSVFDDVTPGALIELYDGALLVDSIGLDLVPLVTFAEAEFSWAGAPVTRAVLDFDEAAADRFIMDNLSFPRTQVPEAGRLLGLSVCVWIGLMAAAHRRRRLPVTCRTHSLAEGN